MAKDVESRVSGGDASAQEARERAAAQFASIHDRWSALGANAGALDPSSQEGDHAGGIAPGWDDPENPEPGPDGVSVTPILGIATSDDAESAQRPRFKTLMGVPRSSPDIDLLAGVDADSRRRARDTVRLERPALRPPAHPTALAVDEAPPASSDEPSLAATSWPWERNAAPRPSPRAIPPQYAALVEVPPDVSAEVAALRASNGWRYWVAGLGAVAAVVALFAVGAPRERTQALRWLRQEFEVRVHPSVEPITDTARALRPPADVAAPGSVSESQGAVPLPAAPPPAATAAAGAESAPTDGSSAAALPAARATTPAATPGPAAAVPETALPAAPAEAATAVPSTGVLPAAPSQSTDRTLGPPENGAQAKATLSSSAAPAPRSATRNARSTAGSTSKARQQVAAPRKRSQRSTALGATATKPRAARQNSPRKDTRDGIIRETPF